MNTAGRKDYLLSLIREGKDMRLWDQLQLTLLLAVPAILAQLSSVMMQYIDTAMVGHLGANPSASIGLMATSTWIFAGFTMAVASGFSVQVAHLCGAGDFAAARRVLRQGLVCSLGISLLFALAGLGMSPALPRWLGGGPEISADASAWRLCSPRDSGWWATGRPCAWTSMYAACCSSGTFGENAGCASGSHRFNLLLEVFP